jgi:mRNA interferase MazF
MKEGNLILTPLLQVDRKFKYRPALILREMPVYKDFLVCGISSQIHQFISDFNELIKKGDSDFAESGLVTNSLIRLSFLAIVSRSHVVGSIGRISRERHERLLKRLSTYLIKELDGK